MFTSLSAYNNSYILSFFKGTQQLNEAVPCSKDAGENFQISLKVSVVLFFPVFISENCFQLLGDFMLVTIKWAVFIEKKQNILFYCFTFHCGKFCVFFFFIFPNRHNLFT